MKQDKSQTDKTDKTMEYPVSRREESERGKAQNRGWEDEI
jgi:hypothetical protein